MKRSSADYIAEFQSVRLDCSGLPEAEEMEMFIHGLHPQIMKLMVTKTPSPKQEATELAHNFNDTKERIDRTRCAGDENRGRMNTAAGRLLTPRRRGAPLGRTGLTTAGSIRVPSVPEVREKGIDGYKNVDLSARPRSA